ncbi:MAG: hypothetical protein VW496_01180 [Pelagibacteraceae bacterium]
MRLRDWDIRLADFIDEVRDRRFDWATWECLRFANEAFRVQTGNGFADDWITGYNSAKSAKKLYIEKQKTEPQNDIIEAVDTRLERRLGKFPCRGDIVGRCDDEMPVLGVSFGVCVSDMVAFLGECGIYFDRPRPSDIMWAVK